MKRSMICRVVDSSSPYNIKYFVPFVCFHIPLFNLSLCKMLLFVLSVV